MRQGSLVSATIALALALASCGGGSSATSKTSNHQPAPTTTLPPPNLKPLLLSVTDLPTGWSVDNSKSGGSSTFKGCKTFNTVNQTDSASTEFTDGGLPVLVESLGWSPNAPALLKSGIANVNQCKSMTISNNGQTEKATMGPMSFPTVGSKSAAYQMIVNIKGLNVDFDIVIAQKGNYLVLVALGDLGPPNTTQLQQFVSAAMTKIPA
jgi:hypothetical protein